MGGRFRPSNLRVDREPTSVLLNNNQTTLWTLVCPTCKKTCRSRIGLYSHSRRCSSTTERRPRRKPIVFRDRRMPKTTNFMDTSWLSLLKRSCNSIRLKRPLRERKPLVSDMTFTSGPKWPFWDHITS